MFPKGPRFQPPKIPDVPGPNTYMIQDSQLDSYKRGAFLEKTDRFSKDKPSEVPGPGTYNAEMKASTTRPSATKPTADRYAMLQRKVEDLERIHADGKKTHQAEIERLRSELARSQKLTVEQSERLEKHKKHSDSLDVRIQELKKATAADQAEIKDLRTKARLSEHERGQLSGKQGEVGEVKKALQSLELKRREEVKDRDKKIGELEKGIGVEKKQRERVEARMQEMKDSSEGVIQDTKARIMKLEIQVGEARGEAQDARSLLDAWKTKAFEERKNLEVQLDQCRSLLNHVVHEYGRLASSSVAISIHGRVKHEYAALQMHNLRLERKLANSEGQVVELAHLVRHTKDENVFLKSQLKDVEAEALWCWQAMTEADMGCDGDLGLDRGLADDAFALERKITKDIRRVLEARVLSGEAFQKFYRLAYDELLFVYSMAEKAFTLENAKNQQHSTDLSEAIAARSVLASNLETARKEHGTAHEQIVQMTATLAEANAQVEMLRGTLTEVETRMKDEAAQTLEDLKRERGVTQRLVATVQKHKMAEDGLRAEIEQLMTELTDTDRYQEAYNNLVEEVGCLVARNALAEDEADRLSKFNAEILGHNNPAQRIMYVDRIRRELAETKQKLLMATRDHVAVVVGNEELKHELDMYKSVMIPVESKPRTNITRIERAPLADQNVNVRPEGPKSVNGTDEGNDKLARLDAVLGDMTLEEIM